MSTSSKVLMGLVLVFLGFERSPDASAAITVRNTAELSAAVEQLRTNGGTIVLRPQRYSAVVVGPRAPRWLTIVAQPGASAARVSLNGTQFVKLVGLRLSPRSGGARLEVRSSSAVRLERLTVAGQGLLPANASVLQSGRVVITDSTFTRCGEGSTPEAGYCLRLIQNRDVLVSSSNFHDCYGCDFLHGAENAGLTIARNSMHRSLVGRCGHSVENCHHQDLIHLRDGRDVRIDANRFGIQEWPGAAQVYLNGSMRGARVTNNVFFGTDPVLPGYTPPRALWIGNRIATDVPRGVVVVHNTMLSGAPRVLIRDVHPTATTVMLSPLYRRLPLAARPIIANNVIGLIGTPRSTCPFVRASRANVVVRGTACTAADVVAAPALGPDGRPTAGSRALIDRADPRYATRFDIDGRPRGSAPDIGAFEFAG